MVNSDPNPQAVAVEDFTGGNSGGVSADRDPAATPGLADDDKQNPPNNGISWTW
jgi:hypothetical protein